MNVLIVVTHLLGTGHLRRALTLAQAFTQAGKTVRLVSGGMPLKDARMDGVDFVQLPPLKSDGINFTTLLDANDCIASESYLRDRAASLLNTLFLETDVIITELFPFGRRVLAAEFEALLIAAQNLTKAPTVLASVRDILAPPSKPEKTARTQSIIDRYYDGVLVHSDPDVIPLNTSWPVDERLQHRLKYTGFVAPPRPAPHPLELGKDEIIVSAGGGPVGAHLFHAARDAARRMPERVWRVLVGGKTPEPLIADVLENAPINLIVEAARPDFRQMLNHAACSVSMAGYNTALDVLQTGVPALFVPFDEGGEREQTLRAKALSDIAAISVLESAKTTGEMLAAQAAQLCHAKRRQSQDFAMNGAHRTVEIVQNLRANT